MLYVLEYFNLLFIIYLVFQPIKWFSPNKIGYLVNRLLYFHFIFSFSYLSYFSFFLYFSIKINTVLFNFKKKLLKSFKYTDSDLLWHTQWKYYITLNKKNNTMQHYNINQNSLSQHLTIHKPWSFLNNGSIKKDPVNLHWHRWAIKRIGRTL